MYRKDFQELARRRVREANALAGKGHFDGAYYLFGLGIECALKACIAHQTKKDSFPDKDWGKRCYTHDLSQLATAAGLNASLDAAVKAGSPVGTYWLVVKDWTVDSRYELIDPKKASAMKNAVTARGHGVMAWIRQHW
jgi:hypothetical protein